KIVIGVIFRRLVFVFGWTALHEACNRGFVSVAVELINAGASVNAKGLDNETPLHDACVNNHLKLVELLLESGASTSIVNRRGQTPADVCRSPVILALLQQSARDTSEVLGLEMSRRTPPSSAVKGPDALKVEIKEEEEQCDEGCDRSCEGSSTSAPQVSSASTSTSSSSSSCSGGRPSSPRVALRITSTGQAKTPDKRNSTDSKSTEGRASSDDPYEFKCTKDETPSSGNKDEEEEESSSKPHTPGKNDSAGEERGEKRSIDDDEDETARKRKRKEEVKDQLPVTPSKNAGKGEKTSKPSSRSCSSNSGPNYTANSGKNSSILGATSGGALAAVDPPTSQDTNRKSPQTSSSSPKSSIKQEKCDEAADEENCSRSDAPNSTNSSSSTGNSSNGNNNNSSPKVPPLKIVLSSCGNNSNNNNPNSGINSTTGGSGSSGGIDQESAGQQSGNGGNKNGNGNGGSSGRHLPYVVSSSSNAGQDHINIKEENNSSAHTSSSTASNNSTHDSKDNLSPLVKEEPLSPGGCEKSATRITRSTRSNTDEAGSAASVKLEVKVEEAAVTSISSTPATLSSATTTPLTATTSVSASSSSTSNNSAPAASSSSTTEVVHPRKRKINIKEEDSDPPPPPSVPELPLSNCYQMFLVIRKQIDDRRKLLFPVQPIPPQGFKDYLMNRATYVLAGNPASQQSVPLMTPPASLPQPLKDLFTEQERARHKLRLLHQIEREKMALCVEQEILRVHGRRAAALANQMLPFSACNILRDQEVYNVLTPEQEEKHRNARSRFNGRLFNSWLQDVDDKWEKIRESMVLRQQNEAESLHAVHRMDWEWKMKEVGLCDNKSNPVIDDLHVPMVAVSDFDHLSA
ncbi:ankyrin repeat domain-containing protein 11, partial [Hyalella azteca]|uniref:Ankyrin repeat domain-containing protein 11 n=1 Tax=Hyalella azteca TaxID=294128 RepID=A0A8B7NLN0_HYAAZ